MPALGANRNGAESLNSLQKEKLELALSEMAKDVRSTNV
jgi:hypothetical protein